MTKPETKTSPYSPGQPSPDVPAVEREMLAFWEETDAFAESVRRRPAKGKDGKSNAYVFYDGPPFANGLPHYGHLLTGYVKDIVARYQTMKGRRVERRFGWDCHGLPAEMGAEKELGVSGRKRIAEYGVGKFNEHCRNSVMQYAEQWKEYVFRQARWVDFDGGYKTMDKPYMESVLWAFKQLYDKGLIYESVRVMPYSWAAETPLSNFETRLDDSYRERADKAATVLFFLKEVPPALHGMEKPVKMAAWTTTPWTLPSNLALAVNPDMNYTAFEDDEDIIIMADFARAKYNAELFKRHEKDVKSRIVLEGENNDVIGRLYRFKGSDLVGLSYEPLFPYFADKKKEGRSFRVLPADFVTEGEGTGVVHLAPGFGEDDRIVCERHGIGVVCPVDSGGRFTEEVPDYAGTQVFEANDPIIRRLKEEDKWLKTEQYLHNYPHCWRTDEPLIYKAVPSWYVEVTKFRDRMVELNQQINWIPSHVKDGQFGKWLENARDWSISRNRFWGTPIPVWRSDNPANKELYVFGSVKELEDFFGREVTDLHRPYIDELTKPDPYDPVYTIRRVEDVFDCWFESGAMPFAQSHYPFENRERFEGNFPADFIVEYVAQTRGWFYTLMVLGTALFDKPPFLNCICHGVVLDEKGQKLSKRLQNYADPREVFEQYGSDALRWVMASAPVMHGGELLIDKECRMVRDAVRLAVKPAWNAFHFFALYADADKLTASYDVSSAHVMDRYVLAECRRAVLGLEKAMDAYDLPAACRQVEGFFETLNNWHIRRSKERFWREKQDADKLAAYNTLYAVLNVVCRAMAPLLPLLAEKIWLGLGASESVHLQDFPDVSSLPEDEGLAEEMARVRDICNAALSVRNKEKIRIRQPLAELLVVDPAFCARLAPYADVIKEELNVKRVSFSAELDAYASRTLKIQFPVLGKRLPSRVKDVIAASKRGEWRKNADGAVEVGGVALLPEEYALLLEPKGKSGAAPLGAQDAMVLLDLEVTEALRVEGAMRDAVRLVQQSRKDAGLDVSDRIRLTVATASPLVRSAVEAYRDYIAEQALCADVALAASLPEEGQGSRFAYEIEGDAVELSVEKA
jgi:isoleucyl-tRNA synthetase